MEIHLRQERQSHEPDRCQGQKIEFDYDALNRMIVKRLPSASQASGKLRPTTMDRAHGSGACL